MDGATNALLLTDGTGRAWACGPVDYPNLAELQKWESPTISLGGAGGLGRVDLTAVVKSMRVRNRTAALERPRVHVFSFCSVACHSYMLRIDGS